MALSIKKYQASKFLSPTEIDTSRAHGLMVGTKLEEEPMYDMEFDHSGTG